MEMTDFFSLLIAYRDVRSENFAAKGGVKRVDFLTFFSRFSHEKISKAFSSRFEAVFVTFSHILISLREARSENIEKTASFRQLNGNRWRIYRGATDAASVRQSFASFRKIMLAKATT
jgi:hypothetical protein